MTILLERESSVATLAEGLRQAWDAVTSSDPGWSSHLPEAGQCAVTALIVQDHLGGDLLRAEVDGQSHYWNRLPDGAEVDLTRGQFEQFDPGPVATRERGYVLSFPDTMRRYRRLRSRLAGVGQ